MRLACCSLVLASSLLFSAVTAWADSGSLSYRARIVHNNRSQLSYVSGQIDLASADFAEQVEQSYDLNWRELPARMLSCAPALPNIWRLGQRTAQRYGAPGAQGGSMPRFDSPLLRHFITGEVLCRVEELKPQAEYLSGQLVIQTAEVDAKGFEIVASFRGTPLVAVGRRGLLGGRLAVLDLAVLGPSSELYQYFFDDLRFAADPPQPALALPEFNPADYVSFPKGEPAAVAIRPVKDWLVFQAQLPNGRPLNLVLDSGAETMIVDDWVLQLDSELEPSGDLPVAGALETGEMQLYKGFSFEAGGVEFKNLNVIGTQLTALGFGANMRIHGIVGSEILQLCRLDLDLENGQMRLSPPDSGAAPAGEQLALTFIKDLPHVEAKVENSGNALLLLDTGQRMPLSVNLDWLDAYKMGDELMMNGFLGDVTGGLQPRYIVENLDLSLGGQTYHEKAVDAGMESTYEYDGMPVVGSIGFPLLARHFGGITFDYSNKLIYLRDPGNERVFAGRPEAWPSKTPAAQEEGSAAALEAARLIARAVAEELPDSAMVHGAPPAAEADSGAEPAKADPRSIYAWAAKRGNLSDPLDLVRAMAPPVPPAPVVSGEATEEPSPGADAAQPEASLASQPTDQPEAAPDAAGPPAQNAPPAEPAAGTSSTLEATESYVPVAPAVAPPALALEPPVTDRRPATALPPGKPERSRLAKGRFMGLEWRMPGLRQAARIVFWELKTLAQALLSR